VIDVSRANSIATGLNNGGSMHGGGGGGTMQGTGRPRSKGGGTLKRSSIGAGLDVPYEPGCDTLRRVHFEKSSTSDNTTLSSQMTPTSPSLLSSVASATASNHQHHNAHPIYSQGRDSPMFKNYS
jgi:hypothetical protein